MRRSFAHRYTMRLRVIRRLLTAGVFVTGLGACAVSRGDLGDKLSQPALAEIKPGQTTMSQVITLLGAPDNIQQIGDQTVFHYYHYALKHATFLVFSRVNIASDDAYVFFARNGVVSEVFTGNRTDQLRFQAWPFGS